MRQEDNRVMVLVQSPIQLHSHPKVTPPTSVAPECQHTKPLPPCNLINLLQRPTPSHQTKSLPLNTMAPIHPGGRKSSAVVEPGPFQNCLVYVYNLCLIRRRFPPLRCVFTVNIITRSTGDLFTLYPGESLFGRSLLDS